MPYETLQAFWKKKKSEYCTLNPIRFCICICLEHIVCSFLVMYSYSVTAPWTSHIWWQVIKSHRPPSLLYWLFYLSRGSFSLSPCLSQPGWKIATFSRASHQPGMPCNPNTTSQSSLAHQPLLPQKKRGYNSTGYHTTISLPLSWYHERYIFLVFLVQQFGLPLIGFQSKALKGTAVDLKVKDTH